MTRASGGGRKAGKGLEIAASSESLLKAPPPPELRDDNAVFLWKTQSEVLIQRKILTIDHFPLLLTYCNSFSLYLQAEAEVSRMGLFVYSDKGGEKKNPAISARQDAINSLVRVGAMLGLDPLSAARLRCGGGDDKDNHNEFSEFL